jgi:hypothetical protein
MNQHILVSIIEEGLTVGLSIPGSALGTTSSAMDRSSVKLSEASNPLAAISIETSVICSSSYGSGRGGGVSVTDGGRGSVDPDAS